jgi:hypothetical protein
MTAQDILDWFTEHHPDVLPHTLRSQIAVAVGNSRSYLNHPVYSRRAPLLWAVGRGRYEPYNLERHGEPGIDVDEEQTEEQAIEARPPVWQLIAQAARELVAPFSLQEVVDWFEDNYPDIPAGTVRTQVSEWSGNSPAYIFNPSTLPLTAAARFSGELLAASTNRTTSVATAKSLLAVSKRPKHRPPTLLKPCRNLFSSNTSRSSSSRTGMSSTSDGLWNCGLRTRGRRDNSMPHLRVGSISWHATSTPTLLLFLSSRGQLHPTRLSGKRCDTWAGLRTTWPDLSKESKASSSSAMLTSGCVTRLRWFLPCVSFSTGSTSDLT